MQSTKASPRKMLKGENGLKGEGLYIAYERLIQQPSLTKKMNDPDQDSVDHRPGPHHKIALGINKSNGQCVK